MANIHLTSLKRRTNSFRWSFSLKVAAPFSGAYPKFQYYSWRFEKLIQQRAVNRQPGYRSANSCSMSALS